MLLTRRRSDKEWLFSNEGNISKVWWGWLFPWKWNNIQSTISQKLFREHSFSQNMTQNFHPYVSFKNISRSSSPRMKKSFLHVFLLKIFQEKKLFLQRLNTTLIHMYNLYNRISSKNLFPWRRNMSFTLVFYSHLKKIKIFAWPPWCFW